MSWCLDDSSIRKGYMGHFSAQYQKIKKICPKTLIFVEMELYRSNIKKTLIFSQKKKPLLSKKSFSYISRNGTLLLSAHALRIKKIYPEKISYALGKGNPENFLLFSQKKAFLMFWKVTFIAQKMKKPTHKKLPIFQEMKLQFQKTVFFNHIVFSKRYKSLCSIYVLRPYRILYQSLPYS